MDDGETNSTSCKPEPIHASHSPLLDCKNSTCFTEDCDT